MTRSAADRIRYSTCDGTPKKCRVPLRRRPASSDLAGDRVAEAEQVAADVEIRRSAAARADVGRGVGLGLGGGAQAGGERSPGSNCPAAGLRWRDLPCRPVWATATPAYPSVSSGRNWPAPSPGQRRGGAAAPRQEDGASSRYSFWPGPQAERDGNGGTGEHHAAPLPAARCALRMSCAVGCLCPITGQCFVELVECGASVPCFAGAWWQPDSCRPEM